MEYIKHTVVAEKAGTDGIHTAHPEGSELPLSPGSMIGSRRPNSDGSAGWFASIPQPFWESTRMVPLPPLT